MSTKRRNSSNWEHRLLTFCFSHLEILGFNGFLFVFFLQPYWIEDNNWVCQCAIPYKAIGWKTRCINLKTGFSRRLWRLTRAAGALGRPKAADTNPQFSRELEVAHTRNRYQSKEEHLGSMLRGLPRGVYGALRAPQARKGGRRPQIRFLGNEKSYTLETGINRKRNISGMF